MNNPSLYLESLIKEFAKLPGIGHKSASRLAFHVLSMSHDDVTKLSSALTEVKEHINTCEKCGGISDGATCGICSDETRDKTTVCVVEEARDILVIENTGQYQGQYHVLRGLISPLDGIGPDELNIASLVAKCGNKLIAEVIIALNPKVEGDATALYLTRLLDPLGITITRIAHGLPVGADLDFADNATIIKSIEGRVRMRG